MAYLKKHFEIEMGVMQDENDILKRELQEFNFRRLKQCQIRHKTPNHKYNMQSPHEAELEDYPVSGNQNPNVRNFNEGLDNS